ncbi:MAG: WbqC family protein [Candidatus Aminicenantes bacterium]|nr:WbqC family protein [Candidatus Aminicenantes bacterium]
MILSFNQPAFIPWGGFFCRLLASDRMVLLDNTLFARGFTFVNRNRVKGPEGEIRLTVPLKKKGLGRQKIKNLEIYQKKYWGKKFLATLSHLYGKSIYFERIYKPLARIIKKQDNQFLNMVIEILEVLRSGLGINTPFILQSQTGVAESGITLLIQIAGMAGADEVILPYPSRPLVDWRQFEKAEIGVTFLKFTAPVYPQFRGDFISCLSILDMLFSLGQESTQLLKKSFTLTG